MVAAGSYELSQSLRNMGRCGLQLVCLLMAACGVSAFAPLPAAVRRALVMMLPSASLPGAAH
jgi:hypothetical protein